jgi:hypothetical protein
MNIWDGLPLPIFCIYLMFFSPNWIYINYIMLALTTIGYLTVIFALVESPKWLLLVGKRG